MGRLRRRRRRVEHRHREGGRTCCSPIPASCSTTSTRRSAAAQDPVQPLHPLVAVPTTTGTGSESTTICVLDVLAQRVKSGISHARLRPTLAVVDPLLTVTQPAGVTASAGMDILCHALESYTARPYTAGAAQAARAAGAVLRREPGLGHVVGAGAVAAGDELPARRAARRRPRRPPRHGAGRDVRRASASATPACTSRTPTPTRSPGRCATSSPTGYPDDEAMVPHGMAVSLTAPEAFRFTFEAAPRAAPAGGAAARPARRHAVGRAGRCCPTC